MNNIFFCVWFLWLISQVLAASVPTGNPSTLPTVHPITPAPTPQITTHSPTAYPTIPKYTHPPSSQPTHPNQH